MRFDFSSLFLFPSSFVHSLTSSLPPPFSLSFHSFPSTLPPSSLARCLTANSFTPWFKLIARDFLFGWWDSLLERRDPKTGLFDSRAVEDLSDSKVWKM